MREDEQTERLDHIKHALITCKHALLMRKQTFVKCKQAFIEDKQLSFMCKCAFILCKIIFFVLLFMFREFRGETSVVDHNYDERGREEIVLEEKRRVHDIKTTTTFQF